LITETIFITGLTFQPINNKLYQLTR